MEEQRIRHPKVSRGFFHTQRTRVAWALIALFAALPYVRIGGHPALLIHLPTRTLYVFGAVFRATDGVALMLFMLTVFVCVFWVTSLFGRIWCGWACPHTVYFEYVFRPIDRFFDTRPRAYSYALKKGVYGVLAVAMANTFFAYFVGVDTLKHWVVSSPSEHPAGFATVVVTAALIFLHFSWVRERLCTVACPYARLQSVLLDDASLIIGYDTARGEPRGKLSRTLAKAQGDCIDCKACVITCPTHIDIRNGLQFECVACAQCVDACDSIMDNIGKPRGLVRYMPSSSAYAQDPFWRVFFKPRKILYTLCMMVLLTALVVYSRSHAQARIQILRAPGAPFVAYEGLVANRLRVNIHNNSNSAHTYTLQGPSAITTTVVQQNLRIEAQHTGTLDIVVTAPSRVFSKGTHNAQWDVYQDGTHFKTVSYTLLGP